jgi:hypothetical protein
MADVLAVFGTLLALGIALPGLLLTWRLLLPKWVARAQQRLEQTPWQCFFGGVIALGVYLIPTLILFNLPWGGFQFIGAVGVFILLTITSIGAAGLAGLMGQRLDNLGVNSSVVGATVRGAVALELAAVFPLIGWFVFIPVTFIMALGAFLFALVGWMPRPAPRSGAVATTQEVSASV